MWLVQCALNHSGVMKQIQLCKLPAPRFIAIPVVIRFTRRDFMEFIVPTNHLHGIREFLFSFLIYCWFVFKVWFLGVFRNQLKGSNAVHLLNITMLCPILINVNDAFFPFLISIIIKLLSLFFTLWMNLKTHFSSFHLLDALFIYINNTCTVKSINIVIWVFFVKLSKHFSFASFIFIWFSQTYCGLSGIKIYGQIHVL